MQPDAVRCFPTPFLRLFLPEAAETEVAWEDFDTQVEIAGYGRPDLQVRSGDLVALIEIKVTEGLAPTLNQPKGYVEFLRKQDAQERWLVFLVPKGWAHLDTVKRDFAALTSTEQSIRPSIIHWEDVAEIIERNDLGALNPFFSDFYALLMARFGPKLVAFTTKEIQMLFSNEIPTALLHLQQVVDGVRDRSTTHKVRPSSSRSLYAAEYGMYFLDARDRGVLWFGVWTEFWRVHGAPLCFGVSENASDAVRQAFQTHYTGPTKHFEKYILGWFGPEALAVEHVIDQVWARLSPLVETVLGAGGPT